MATTDQHVFFRTQGDCVIEDNVFGAFLSDIRETPETDWPQLISEMSRAVEALVLFERSFVFSYQIDEDNDIAYFGTDNPLPLCSIIEELSKEKVLNFVSLVPIDSSPQPSAMLAQVNELQIVPKDLVSKFNEFNFAYYLYQQEIARHHDLPFVSTDSEYARSFVTGSNILKYSLSQKLVQNMNLTISKDFDNLIRTNREFSFFVPPFLAVVLDKVIKGASFGTAILELRHQFRSLRTMFMDYDRELHAPDLTVKEQLKRSARIVKEIEKASSAFSIKDRTKFTLWGDTFDFLIDSTTDISNFNPIKTAGLIPRLTRLSGQVLINLMLKRRYNSLYKLKEDFYSIRGYSDLLHKATTPLVEKAKNLNPIGTICVLPGNPFQDPRNLYR